MKTPGPMQLFGDTGLNACTQFVNNMFEQYLSRKHKNVTYASTSKIGMGRKIWPGHAILPSYLLILSLPLNPQTLTQLRHVFQIQCDAHVERDVQHSPRL